MSTTTVLRLCPFCGGAAKIKRGKTVMVGCTVCTASTFQVGGDDESAIKNWNLMHASLAGNIRSAAHGEPSNHINGSVEMVQAGSAEQVSDFDQHWSCCGFVPEGANPDHIYEAMKSGWNGRAALQHTGALATTAPAPSKAGELTDEQIHELWQRSYLTALEQAGVCIGNVDVAHMNQPIVFARALLSSAPAQAAQSEDAKLLDWLEQHGHVRFTFENAEISFQIPDELEGANSIRELIKSSMDDVKDE